LILKEISLIQNAIPNGANLARKKIFFSRRVWFS